MTLDLWGIICKILGICLLGAGFILSGLYDMHYMDQRHAWDQRRDGVVLSDKDNALADEYDKRLKEIL